MSEQWQQPHTIRASEVGEYVYCNRQWWLKRVHGVRPISLEKMEMGTSYHNEHWQALEKVVRNEKLIMVLIAAAAMLIVLAALFAI